MDYQLQARYAVLNAKGTCRVVVSRQSDSKSAKTLKDLGKSR